MAWHTYEVELGAAYPDFTWSRALWVEVTTDSEDEAMLEALEMAPFMWSQKWGATAPKVTAFFPLLVRRGIDEEEEGEWLGLETETEELPR